MTLLLDTMVLAYATGDPTHPLALASRRIVEQVISGRIRATTTTENLQEFLHLRGRRTSRADAAEQVHDFASLLTPVIGVDEATIRRAASEYAKRDAIGAADSVMVAVLLRNDELELVTADRGLLAQHDLPVRSLDEFGVGR